MKQIAKKNISIRVVSILLAALMLFSFTGCNEVVKSESAANLENLVKTLFNAPNGELERTWSAYSADESEANYTALMHSVEAVYGELIAEEYLEEFGLSFGISATHAACQLSGGKSGVKLLRVSKMQDTYSFSSNIECMKENGSLSVASVAGYAEYDENEKIVWFEIITDMAEYYSAIGYSAE